MIELHFARDSQGTQYFQASLCGVTGLWKLTRQSAYRALLQALVERGEIGLFTRALGVREVEYREILEDAE